MKKQAPAGITQGAVFFFGMELRAPRSPAAGWFDVHTHPNEGLPVRGRRGAFYGWGGSQQDREAMHEPNLQTYPSYPSYIFGKDTIQRVQLNADGNLDVTTFSRFKF